MTKYRVYGTWDAEWVVEAEDADAAEDLVDAGEAGDAEITGYSVDNVVTDGKAYDAPDEREKCTCGHNLRDHGSTARYWLNGEWHPKACHTYDCRCQSRVPADTEQAKGGDER